MEQVRDGMRNRVLPMLFLSKISCPPLCFPGMSKIKNKRTFEIPGALKMFPMTGNLRKNPRMTGKKSLEKEKEGEDGLLAPSVPLW